MYIRRKFSKGDNDYEDIFTSLEEFMSYSIKLEYQPDEEADEDILDSISIRINGDLYYYVDGGNLDLRKEYQAYDLYLRSYKMSSESKNNIWNLFRLYGYQINITNIKPLTFMYNNKRRYFNYLKISNVIFTDSTVAKFSKCKELLDILRREYEEGIVYYHPYKDSFNKYTCDFDKSLENFEVSLT